MPERSGNEVHRWLRAGAVAAGLGAAAVMAPGIAVSAADDGANTSSEHSKSTGSSARHSAGSSAKAAKSAAARSSSSAGSTVAKTVKPAAAPKDDTDVDDTTTDTPSQVEPEGADLPSTTSTTTTGDFKFESVSPVASAKYPDEVTAPVTPKAIVSDLIEWTGQGTLPPDIPEAPLPDLIGAVWVAARKLHYRLANSDPTATYVQTGQDSDTGEIEGAIVAADADGDVLTYRVTDDPEHGTVTVKADGTYEYTPDPEYAHLGGTDSFTVDVSDDNAANPWHLHGLADLLGFDEPTRVIVIASIAPVNHAPTGTATITNVDKTTGAVTVTVATADSDSDPVTTTAATEPKYGTLVANSDGTWTYTPDYTAAHAVYTDPEKSPTEDGVAFTATDSYGATSTVSVTVPIVALNQTITNSTPTITLSTNQKGEVSAELGVADPDSDPLTHTVTTQATWGSVDLAADGSFVYLASDKGQHEAAYYELAGKTLDDTFTITTADGHGDSTTTTVTVTIAPANQAPVVTDSTVTYTIPIDQFQSISGTVQASDPDGDTLTYSISTQGVSGTATIDSAGNYTYVSSDVLSESFTITISDGLGGQTTQTVKVNKLVTPILTETQQLSVALDGNATGSILSFVNEDGLTSPASQLVVSSTANSWKVSTSGSTVVVISRKGGVVQVTPPPGEVLVLKKDTSTGYYGLFASSRLTVLLDPVYWATLPGWTEENTTS